MTTIDPKPVPAPFDRPAATGAGSTPAAWSPEGWTPQQAADLYGINDWSEGYFAVTPAGTIAAKPLGQDGPAVDLHELTEGLRRRGVHPPVIVRFRDMVKHRLHQIKNAFDHAINTESYRGDFRCVYPIKVNQQRTVVEELRDFGRPLGFGLEAGSKPELLAVLGLTTDQLTDIPIICNGFKDDEYVETVILAAKLGRNITPVVEQPRELELIIHHARAHGVRPSIGVRAKPSTAGAGRWESSAGSRSKFGLSMSGLLDALDTLKHQGMADCLKLLHFHIGSQVADIRALNAAVGELAHIYCELANLGAGLNTIDIGGGLGVDYDGSGTTQDGSINYTLDEYAANVVHRVMSACDDAGVEHPTIITESGRAMTAYASALIVDVPAVTTFDQTPDDPEASTLDTVRADLTDDTPQPIRDLVETAETVDTLAPLEALHDTTQAHAESMALFKMGYMSLRQRAAAEKLAAQIGRRLLDRAQREADLNNEDLPDEFATLAEDLSDIYYINASVFQSLPDAWAIDQLFPVAPIQRLNEKPTRLASLADVTCDSDGKIDRFGDAAGKGVRNRLPLHPLHPLAPAGPSAATTHYSLGIFLVGAYQEVLGDLHNLFGDTHAVHIALLDPHHPHHHDTQIDTQIDNPDRSTNAPGWTIEEVVEGDTVKQVLSYVGFDTNQLRRAVRADIERAVRGHRLDVEEGRALLTFYDQGLDGYTYLE